MGSTSQEHQALLRARHAAGDALAEDFLVNIANPLRYPKTDPTETQIAEIHVKARMEAERPARGVREGFTI